MAHEITDAADFKSQVLESDGGVVVDFYAPWCGPCQAMGPIVDEITEVKVIKVNIDETPELAQEYGVMGVPTFIGFKDGSETGRKVGMSSKEELIALAQ